MHFWAKFSKRANRSRDSVVIRSLVDRCGVAIGKFRFRTWYDRECVCLDFGPQGLRLTYLLKLEVVPYNDQLVLPSVGKKLGRTNFTLRRQSTLIKSLEKITSCQFGRYQTYQSVTKYVFRRTMHKEATHDLQVYLLFHSASYDSLRHTGPWNVHVPERLYR